MKKHLLILSCVLLVASPLLAQMPTLGVYFDEEATDMIGFSDFPPDIATAYIMVKDAEAVIGGAAFGLELDPDVALATAIPFDENAIEVGGLVTHGYVEIGLDFFLPVFGDDFGMLYTIEMYAFSNVLNGAITVTSHPNYETPIVADNEALQMAAAGLTSYVNFHALPNVCVYFDEEGTLMDTAYTEGEILNAYVMVRDAEMMVAGAALKLDALDPVFVLAGTIYPDGQLLGNLYDGMELGLFDYIPVFGSDAGLLATMVLFVEDNEVPHDAQFEIVPHPNYDNIVVSDNYAFLWPATTCGVSTVDVPIPNEDLSWSDVKTLYK